MARLARTVVSGLPHHVTQRGNRREAIFFEDGDQEVYRDLLAEQTRKARVDVWACCLMPDHVHLILTPTRADGLGLAVGEAHRRVQYSIECPASRTCSWRMGMRPLLRFVAPKVPGVRLVLRSLSLGLNAYSDGGSHVAPQDLCRKLRLTPSS